MDRDQDKHYFHLKGKKAEEITHDLALQTFLTDWCYLNPELPDGKELCDLLVVFDDTAIIWQIKDLKIRNGKYSEKEVQKNLRQLSGARRQLFDLRTPVELQNPRRGKEIFNPEVIEKVYLISVLQGEGELASKFIENIKNHTVHVFSKEFTQVILNELDTISDFTDYLGKLEELIKLDTGIIVSGGEEELLAHYLMDNRSFEKFHSVDMALIDHGQWDQFINSPKYFEKKRQDEISFVWDDIINCAHRCETKDYEEVARELARHNRFERRCLSKAFFEGQTIAHKSAEDIFRRVMPCDDVTYTFLFMNEPDPREDRKAMLTRMCWIARGKYENHKVIGIATEKTIQPMRSYDFCLLELHEWTEEHQQMTTKMQEDTGIFKDVRYRRIQEDEYPEISP